MGHMTTAIVSRYRNGAQFHMSFRSQPRFPSTSIALKTHFGSTPSFRDKVSHVIGQAI
jgi:hypothetical protein